VRKAILIFGITCLLLSAQYTPPPGGGSGTTQSLTIGASFDGSGAALSGTYTECTSIPYSGTITGVYTTADVSGSATLAVATVASGSYTGTAGFSGYTSIVASDPPSLSSAVYRADAALTGWSTSLTAGQMLCFQLTSPSSVTHVEVAINY
jgi:hypothetical protein